MLTMRQTMRRTLAPAALVTVLAAPLAAQGHAPGLPPVLAAADRTPTGPVEAEMHHVLYRAAEAIILDLHDLRGALVPARPPAPPWLEDASSFVIAIDSAVVGITPASLTALLNGYVFNYDGTPLDHLNVSIVRGELRLSGKLRSVAGVPFTIRAVASATADGKLRLHPTSVKVVGVSVQWLMHMLGVELNKVVGRRPGRGVQVVGNDFVLTPAELLPPPVIHGLITDARIDPDAVVLTFGASQRPGRGRLLGSVESTPRNFVRFRGAVLRFGKLTMVDTDLRIVDADQSDPFDLFFDHLDDQLVAGHVRTMADFGLIATMPDFDDMQRTPPPVAP